ncbi:unnamed protein product [Phytophthora lilii]|uniref:Unnamed protein product n=1 Tax=Phytophthora lilii TaxID=2077276 RepID=A0A9W6UA62_9STRA|nr:unnamed protein product [Phytophthora lilii]
MRRRRSEPIEGSLVMKIKDSKQIYTWLKGGQTSEQVLGLLKMDKTVDEILEKPQFKLLESFVKKYNKNNPEKSVDA